MKLTSRFQNSDRRGVQARCFILEEETSFQLLFHLENWVESKRFLFLD